MMDTSSSGNAPSLVACPLAKLGRLSPSAAIIASSAGTGRPSYGNGLNGCASSPPLSIHSRRFKLASSTESLNYRLSSSEHNKMLDPPHRRESKNADGPGNCNDANYVRYSSPAYQCYKEIDCHQSPLHHPNDFYCNSNKKDENSPMFFQTTLKCHSPGRISPFLDQGYHTLVPPSPPGWPMITVSKLKKVPNRCNHVERLPDVVLLQIFSWLSTNDLCSVSRVCRRWYNLACDQSLWKTISLHGERICADKAIKSILRRLCGQGQNGTCSTVKQLFVFDGAKITDKGLSSLARRCFELTHVQLQNSPTISDSSVSELMTRCPNIQHLDLTGCSLVSCVDIIAGPNLPQKLLLQHLDLTDCISVQDSSLRIILRNCPQLTYLYLRRCSRITDAGVKFVPSFCSSLRELSVSDCHLVTDFALYELAKLGSNLRYLSVAKCGQVSDAGLKVIAKRCYKMRYLNVRGCEAVSDDALTAIARSCPRLRALDIGKCDVSDAGLKVLAENCPNLKKLSLRNCDLVTDRGIQYVCYYCRGLQQLNIQDCQISLEGYKAVKKFCKRCIIEHTNPGFF